MDALERGTPTIQQVGSVPNRPFSEQCRVYTRLIALFALVFGMLSRRFSARETLVTRSLGNSDTVVVSDGSSVECLVTGVR